MTFFSLWEKTLTDPYIYTVKPASSQPSAKKHWILSVNCRRPARTLRTGVRPDHGPKNGAMNLEAGLLNFELRPRFWVRNLTLFLRSQNTHRSCDIELRIGSKERYAGTCAAATAGWQSMRLWQWGYTLWSGRLKYASLGARFQNRVSCAIASAGQTHCRETVNYGEAQSFLWHAAKPTKPISRPANERTLRTPSSCVWAA